MRVSSTLPSFFSVFAAGQSPDWICELTACCRAASSFAAVMLCQGVLGERHRKMRAQQSFGIHGRRTEPGQVGRERWRDNSW